MIDLESLSLGQVFQKRAELDPAKTAVICGTEQKTYSEMDALKEAVNTLVPIARYRRESI